MDDLHFDNEVGGFNVSTTPEARIAELEAVLREVLEIALLDDETSNPTIEIVKIVRTVLEK